MNFAKVVMTIKKLEDSKQNGQFGNNISKGTFYEVGSRFYKSNQTSRKTNNKQIHFGNYKLCNQVGRGKNTQH
jgi:hypothetical protein